MISVRRWGHRKKLLRVRKPHLVATKASESVDDADSGERCIIEFKRERSRTQRRGDVTDDAVATSLMICCGFIVCWSLNQFYSIVSFFGGAVDFTGWFYHFTVVMVFLNSCINPFIYAAKYREFQAGVRRLLRISSTQAGSVT